MMAHSYTVNELCEIVDGVFKELFVEEVWVTGAISGLNRSASGHVYFNLTEPSDLPGKAASAVLPVVLFESARQRVNRLLKRGGQIRMRDGIEIRIKGRLAYYPAQSRVQLVMSLIDPAYTIGQLEIARDALLAKLAAEGLLHANKSHDLPPLPKRVALVTSANSAAHADFSHELTTSPYHFDVEVFDARVQGTEAISELSAAIEAAGKAGRYDVVVLIRGGGSRTDLAAFDSEAVARAIAQCPVPVIVGVGHEIDRSVADEVAAVSAKTPTAAAAVLTNTLVKLDHFLRGAAERLANLTRANLSGARADTATHAVQLQTATARLLTQHENRLMRLGDRLAGQADRRITAHQHRLTEAELRLAGHDPAVLLSRGWSITHNASGHIVHSVADLSSGELVTTTLADGSFAASVTGTNAASVRSSAAATPSDARSPS